MASPHTYTGAPWKAGLPPGIYEDRPGHVVPRDVRMDVAAFVGLAQRGPVSTPVVVESWGEFRAVFGEAGGDRLLPQSVHLFFANGGRRCVVVRAVDYGNASTAALRLNGLETVPGGDPLRIFARNPGAWGNGLSVAVEFKLYPAALQYINGENSTVRGRHDRLRPGSLLRFVARETIPHPNADVRIAAHADGRPLPEVDRLREQLVFINEIRPASRLDSARTDGVLIELSSELPAIFRGDDVVAMADEVRVRLEVRLDGVLVESWNEAAFHPLHERFLHRLIARRAPSEALMASPRFEPDESSAVESQLLFGDSRYGGSEFVRPAQAWSNVAFLPSAGLLGRTPRVTSAVRADTRPGAELGSDGGATFEREHFFSAPGKHVSVVDLAADARGERRYVFAAQLAPFEAIAEYDDRNETQPVSLVHLPDLLHIRSEEIDVLSEAPDCTLRFGSDCSPEPETRPKTVYPNLAHSREGTHGQIEDAQRRIIEWCERKADRIAILDLPPGLGGTDVLNWRRRVTSDRAALYAPFLRTPPADDPLGALIVVPPGAAVCGIFARRERDLGVHAAPANETLVGVVRLLEEPRLPDPGFLHEARVDSIRATERGFDLLGSRTTSADRDWTHVSVRRLIDFLKRQLAIDSQWATFEPNDRRLWGRLEQFVSRRLGALYDAGAFSGGSPSRAFFVRSDSSTTSPDDIDTGRVITLVGVAPAVPAEFIVFRLTRLDDGSINVEELDA